MRFVAAHIPEGGRFVTLEQRPIAVWRWSRPTAPPAEADPALFQVMHEGHDWTWTWATLVGDGGRVRYSFSDRSEAWIIVQYGETTPRLCPLCSKEVAFDWRFCIQCGHRLTIPIERVIP